MAPANAYAAYRTAEIETISQRDLIVKLYEGAERFLRQAQVAMRQRQTEIAHNNCLKARRIFIELTSTLNFELGGDIAGHLRDLYLFVIAHITEANLRKSPEKIDEVMPIITSLRSAWEQIPAEFAGTTSMPSGNQGHSFNLRT
jgi:flagellar protein FliS